LVRIIQQKKAEKKGIGERGTIYSLKKKNRIKKSNIQMFEGRRRS